MGPDRRVVFDIAFWNLANTILVEDKHCAWEDAYFDCDEQTHVFGVIGVNAKVCFSARFFCAWAPMTTIALLAYLVRQTNPYHGAPREFRQRSVTLLRRRRRMDIRKDKIESNPGVPRR